MINVEHTSMSFIYFFKLKRATNDTTSSIGLYILGILLIYYLSHLTLTKYELFLEICIPNGYSYAFQIANAKGKRKKTRYKIWVDKWKNGVSERANE